MRLDTGLIGLAVFLTLLVLGYPEFAILAALLFLIMMAKKEKQQSFQDFEPPKGEGHINLLDITKDAVEFSAKFTKKTYKTTYNLADKIVMGAIAIAVGLAEGAKAFVGWIRRRPRK